MSERAADILHRVFGFNAFRGQQQAIIEHVVGGGDALVLMPTGAGKSLCYQVPALVRPGTGIVVSPLIALMQDQVDALCQLGVAAACLNSSLDGQAAAEVERRLLAGALDLLYVAPERLLTPRCLDLLDQVEVALFAIDEAHCVSQWGHDFRPEYRQLDVLHARWPQVPRIALTATADTPTRAEIVERLELADAACFTSSFDRPNIRYSVVDKDNPQRQLLAFLAGHRGESGIVYCLSRRRVDETALALAGHGIEALPYHAGMDAAQRAANQRRFLREDGVVMVATIAFGMGIDKPDVRFVAHLDLPKSMEGYYQETGRAGRDGEPAQAWLCHGMADVVNLRRFIDQPLAEAGDDIDEETRARLEQRRRVEIRKLDALVGYCESLRCRRQVLLEYFGERLERPCGNCDTCLDPPQSWDGTQAARMALSAAWRTGQRFGAGHLIDVLRGKATDKVRQQGHDGLPTFGVGADLDERDWRAVLRQLVALGRLQSDIAGYGALHLTEAAGPVLRGQQAVLLRRPAARAGGRSRRPKPAAAATLDARGGALFEALRAWRARTAKAQNVPPYVVFHDATLQAIADAAPDSLDALAGLHGVGAAKLARYGTELLAVVAGEPAPATATDPA